MASRNRAVARLAAGLLVGLLAGCTLGPTANIARIVPAERPASTTLGLRPPPPEDDSRTGLNITRPGGFTAPNLLTFAAAREAYWNYDTATAVRLLHQLRADDGISDHHLHFLILQCYEQSEKWAETLPLYAQFGIEESRRDWLNHARLRAALKPLDISFHPSSPLAMKVKPGGHAIVDVEVNGTKARVLVDTGANLSWWTKSFARRAGLDSLSHTIALHDAHAQSRDTDLALIRKLRVGGMTARNVPTLVGRSWSLWLIGIDGIVGWDTLQYAKLVFDFPARQLTVGPPDDSPPAGTLLSGRVQPILTVQSAEGQPLHLFLDTGAASRDGGFTLFENEGMIAAKVPTAAFRRTWRPTVSMGMHSLRVSWPRQAQPFAFWMDGYRIEIPRAHLQADLKRQEQLAYLDGIIGNGPFLGGRLTLCGVQRIARFEPTVNAGKDGR